MRDTTDSRRDKHGVPGDKEGSALSKWLWFAGLYLAGLLTVVAVAWFFRALLGMN